MWHTNEKMLYTLHSEICLCPLKNNPKHRLSSYTESAQSPFKMSTSFNFLPT